MNIKEEKAYKCTECGFTYLDKAVAERCCAPRYCDDCGKELPHKWYSSLCEPCKEKKCYDAAEKLTIEQYCLSYPGNMVYYGDTYYADVDDCLESLFEKCSDEEEVEDLFRELKYVYGTDKYRVELDADSILEDMEENSNIEDYEVDDTGRKEFVEYVEKWNEKYGSDAYACTKVVILLDDEYKKKFIN